MSNFISRTKANIHDLMIYPIRVGMALPVVIAMLLVQGYQISKINSVTTQVKHGLLSQTTNRAKNVGVWCGSINGLQTQLELYVDQFHAHDPQIPQLHLKQLECTHLETATVKSAKP